MYEKKNIFLCLTKLLHIFSSDIVAELATGKNVFSVGVENEL
jgi:hypothetical protein